MHPRGTAVARAAVETLEDRKMLSVTVVAKKLALNVVGTSDDDAITVTAHRNLINVLSVSIANSSGREDRLVSVGRFRTINVVGGDGNDTIRVENSLNGLAGDVGVWIDAGNGDDSVLASGLPGTIALRAGNDRVKLDAPESLKIYGDAGNDRVEITGSTHEVNGGDGDDVITLGAGAHTVRGGAGGDRISVGEGYAKLEGNEGNDTISAPSQQGKPVLAGDGDDRVTIYLSKSDRMSLRTTVEGGAGRDTIIGSKHTESLSGGEGDDQLIAGVGSASDTVLGGNGDDVLDATGTHGVYLYAGAGDDDLYSGVDTVGEGQAGTDWFEDDNGWFSKDQSEEEARLRVSPNTTSYSSGTLRLGGSLSSATIDFSGGYRAPSVYLSLRRIDDVGYVVVGERYVQTGRSLGSLDPQTTWNTVTNQVGQPVVEMVTTQPDARPSPDLTAAERKALRHGIVRLPDGWSVSNAERKQGDLVWYDVRFGKGGDKAKATEFEAVYQLCVKAGTVIVTSDGAFTSRPGRIARARADIAAMWLKGGTTARVAGETATYRISDGTPTTAIKAAARQRGIFVDGGVIWLPFEDQGTRFVSL